MPSAAVLGKPIAHSLSPVLHRAAYAALELSDWTYDAIECDEDSLAALLAASGPEVVGYSCTMPLKRQVLAVADSVSARAAAIGAGNTLLQIDGEWHADNTDWIGVSNALAEQGWTGSGNVVILGAGGTAQAALAAVDSDGPVTVLVRDASRTDDLLDTAGRLEIEVRIAPLHSFPIHLGEAAVVISTLPAGASDSLADASTWRDGQVLLDVVYSPWPTQLATAAEKSGVRVASGAAMLLHQAVRQVELMTGCPVAGTTAEQAMRVALRHAAPDSGV